MNESGVSTVVFKTDKLTIVEWNFERFFDDLQNISLYSKSFCLGDEEYYLYIATEYVPDSLDCISLGVFQEGYTSGDLCVSCTLGVKNPNGSVIQSFEGQLTYDYEGLQWKCTYRPFVSKSKLLQSMDVEIVTFFCILCHEDSVFAKSWTLMQTPSSQSLVTYCPVEAVSSSSKAIGTLLQNFKDLFVSQSDGDVKILVDGREFKAHTCVLKARSKVFASMFEHNMAEKNSGVINITDCKPEIFEAFLLFLYSGELHHVTPANAVDLYKVSEKYNMDEMEEACIQCLASNLSVNSICDVIQLAVVHSESELLRTATNFFIDNMETILITEKWRDFIVENPLVANELFIKMTKREKTEK